MPANHVTRGLTQRFARAITRRVAGWRQAEHHSRNNREAERKRKDPRIDSNHLHAGNFSRRRQRCQSLNTPESEQDSSPATYQRNQGALRQQLAHEATAVCPQRAAHRHFLDAARCSS